MLQGDEVQISALKEYVPRGHAQDLHLFLPFFPPHYGLQNSNVVQQKAV